MGENKKQRIEYFKVKNKMVLIEFDKIFNDPSLAKYNFFRMSVGSKRFYAEHVQTFVDGCNDIMNRDLNSAHNILYQYLNLKKGIDENKFTNYKSFINFLVTNLFSYKPKDGNKSVLEIIKEYIAEEFIDLTDRSYELNMDKFEKAMMFFRIHYIILFELTAMSKFVIPLAIHYIVNNPKVGMDADTFLYHVIMELISLAPSAIDENGEFINIYLKLYRHIQKHMEKTEKTDKPGLTRLQIYSITISSTIETVLKKILTNMLPIYVFDKDVMKFNQSVIRTSIDIYTLRKQDPIPARCIINDGEGFGDEENTGMELFQSYNKNKNEKTIIFRKFASDLTMDAIARRYDVTYTNAEYNFYLKNIQINNLQVTLVSQILATDFGGADNISGCDEKTFIKGIIIIHKRMLRLGLINLANLIVAKKTSTILNKCQLRTLIKKIQANPAYNKVIENRYTFIKDLFVNKITTKADKNHPIIDIMKTLMNENYVYNGYNDPDNGKPIHKDEDKLLDEVINLYQLLIV